MNPDFNLTQEEHTLVLKIELRIRRIWPDEDSLSRVLDIVATNNHICRLRLADLLNADDFNFAHDIMGIAKHLDRKNITLKDGFWPRYSE